MKDTNIEKYYMNNMSYYNNMLSEQDISVYKKYINFLKSSNGKNILEFGCGIGQVTNKLKEDGYNSIGIDISPIAIDMAKNRGKGCFNVLQSEMLPFDDNYFDSVGTFNVLEHLSNPEHWIEEMIRVLRHNGSIVIACPNFLRILGIRAHHWHTRGYYNKLKNTYFLLKKFINSKFYPYKMIFDFMEPKINKDNFEPDDDAICITNPIDISFILKKYGIDIKYSSSSYMPSSYLIEKIGELPIIRTVTGQVFIVGIKRVKTYDDKKN